MLEKESSSTDWRDRTFLLRNADRLSGFVLAAIAAFAIYESSHLPFGAIWAPDAGFFPLSLSVLLLIIAFVGIVASYIGQQERAEFWGRSSYVPVAGAALVIYALALPTVGFVIATVAVLLLMTRGFGGMSWPRSLLISLVAVIATYAAFRKLGVPLPSGLLPF